MEGVAAVAMAAAVERKTAAAAAREAMAAMASSVPAAMAAGVSTTMTAAVTTSATTVSTTAAARQYRGRGQRNRCAECRDGGPSDESLGQHVVPPRKLCAPKREPSAPGAERRLNGSVRTPRPRARVFRSSR
jgi:hypothetical protein